MFSKLEETFINLVMWILKKLSLNGKNNIGISMFLFSTVWGVAAYLCFNPPYDYYGYGLEYSRIRLVNILIGRSALGWIYAVASVGCTLIGIIATYKAFYPEKPD